MALDSYGTIDVEEAGGQLIERISGPGVVPTNCTGRVQTVSMNEEGGEQLVARMCDQTGRDGHQRHVHVQYHRL